MSSWQVGQNNRPGRRRTNFQLLWRPCPARHAQVRTTAARSPQAQSLQAAASRRSIANWRLTIGAGAAGGSATKLPFAENGSYCTLGRPREQVRAAISVFRDSGIDPADLLSTQLTKDLLN